MNGLNIYTASYSSGCSLSLPTTIDRSASAAANMNQSKKGRPKRTADPVGDGRPGHVCRVE